MHWCTPLSATLERSQMKHTPSAPPTPGSWPGAAAWRAAFHMSRRCRTVSGRGSLSTLSFCIATPTSLWMMRQSLKDSSGVVSPPTGPPMGPFTAYTGLFVELSTLTRNPRRSETFVQCTS
eukprot:4307247-Pyramimonas_sp.AAC.1